MPYHEVPQLLLLRGCVLILRLLKRDMRRESGATNGRVHLLGGCRVVEAHSDRCGEALFLLAVGRRGRERGDDCLEVCDGTHGCAGVLVSSARVFWLPMGGTAENIDGPAGAQTRLRGRTELLSYSMADRVCDM